MGGMRNADMPFRRGQPAGGGGPSHEMLPDKSVDGQVRKAARSGKLDIASLSLDSVPSTVFTALLGIPADQLSRPPPPFAEDTDTIKGLASSISTNLRLEGKGTREQAFGSKPREEEWSEPEELTSLKADHNLIRDIDVEVGAFGGLKVLDLSHNQLTSLPDTLADLLRLTSLNLSNNLLSSVPPAILLLPKLEVLCLSHNNITTISLTDGIEPSDEGMSYGAGFLSTSFSRAAKNKQARAVLPVLRSLDLSHNKLTTDGLKGFKDAGARGLPGMRVLNLEQNALIGLLNVQECGIGKDGMVQLASLNLKGNRGLQAVEEQLAEGCKVDLEGTASVGGSAGSSDPASSSTVGPSQVAATGASARAANADASAASQYPITQPSTTVVYKTTPAASFDSLPLKIDMDVYLPPSASDSAAGCPMVIWFHGGGLLQGNKENLPPHFRRLPCHAFPTGSAADGERCIVISPNYRLAPQCSIIDILSDIRDCIAFVKSGKLDAALSKAPESAGKGFKVDPTRICLSGGSAGGYLALMASIRMPKHLTDEQVGGYRGEEGIRCCAPFYPITDLTHAFWATKTDPVPWWSGSVPHEAAKPHLNPRDPPVSTAVSGGPRSILYPYMLQHGLFPSLLFLSQRSIGSGLDGFRPDPLHLSVTHRLETLSKLSGVQGDRLAGAGAVIPPTFLIYGDVDDKINPLERDVELLKQLDIQKRIRAGAEVVVRPGADHGFDENADEECLEFRSWLGKNLF